MSTGGATHDPNWLIWVKCHNEAMTSLETLSVEHQRQSNLKPTPGREALREALWDGIWLLKKEAKECAKQAQRQGLLPFCWAGTSILKGGAA